MGPTELRSTDDAALLARARDGDVAAYGELVRRHQVAALRLAAVVSGSTSEAADIVQDAFVAVHRRLDSYRGTGSVRSWMLRAVANHAKNEVRGRVRRRRREEREATIAVRHTPGADDLAIARWEHERLAGALAGLSDRDRAVLGCRYVTGLSEAETAEILGVAIGTVKSRTARALRRLDDAFHDEEVER